MQKRWGFMSEPCICGSKKSFANCCGRFLEQGQHAKTPEQLMRSRYSAYALGGYGFYLLGTWLPTMTRGLNEVELSQKNQDWCGLDILHKSQQGDNGVVEFMAHYHLPEGGQSYLKEKSIFKRLNGRWLYVGAEIEGGKA